LPINEATDMFFLADKAYHIRGVPPMMRTVLGIPSALWVAGAAAVAAVALVWLAMAI
jgi:hypothetical protein